MSNRLDEGRVTICFFKIPGCNRTEFLICDLICSRTDEFLFPIVSTRSGVNGLDSVHCEQSFVKTDYAS